MKAIFKRELKAYFASPVGYVVVAALLALYGFFYYQVMMIGSSSYISQVFGTMFTFCMMIIPIITMRSMSDERKNKTDQALLTAPVSVTAIVLGKFFAAFGVYFVANALALLPAFAISLFATAFPWGIMIGNFAPEKVRQALGLRETLVPVLILALGKPDETIVLEEAKDGETGYYRDADDVHHVPKRPLSELIV